MKSAGSSLASLAQQRLAELLPKSVDAAAIALWHDDPARFCREVLKYTPWNRQTELFNAVAEHNFVAVRSGHKCSKSRSLASIALWWVATRPRGKVVLTAPSYHQVTNILWPEVSLLYNEAALGLGGRLYTDSHKGLKYEDGRHVFCITTDVPERFAGISGAELLILVDEASGFPEPLYDAVFGNLAGGGKVVLAGNPTRTSGTFYDAFNAKRDSWKGLHIASTETPNFHGGKIKGLADPAWKEWAEGMWGKDTPMWDVRVMGNFPKAGENTIVSLAMLEAALAAYDKTPAEGRLELGVDPARFGDDASVICARRGPKVLGMWDYRGLDGPGLAQKVIDHARELRDSARRPVVKIDPIGVGASPTDFLRGFDEIELVELDAGSASTTHDYARFRDEMWFALPAFFKAGGVIPKHPKLEGELVSPTYSYDIRGRIKVESKDDMRKRLKRSPDHADALALCVFPVEQPITEFPAPHVRYFEEAGIG